MTNDQMKPYRWQNLYESRKRLAWIQERMADGLTVYVCIYGHTTKYTPKLLPTIADYFKATKSGFYERHGRQWLCADGAKLIAQ